MARLVKLSLLLLVSSTIVESRPTPKALLINLPKHEERFRTVKEQLEKAEVDFEKADAVDGRKLTVEDQEARVTALGRALMTPGMIGCFLSHKSCWERCVQLANGPIIVFEDDVILAENFTASLHAAMDELPEGWDVLLLGALGAVHPSYYCTNFLHAMMAGGLRWPRGARKAFSDAKPVAVHTPLRPFGTHAYVISEGGAKKLLAAAPRANYHVDVVAWGMRSLKLYAVHPLLAKQTHGDTTIGGANDRTWLPEIIIDPCALPHCRTLGVARRHSVALAQRRLLARALPRCVVSPCSRLLSVCLSVCLSVLHARSALHPACPQTPAPTLRGRGMPRSSKSAGAAAYSSRAGAALARLSWA